MLPKQFCNLDRLLFSLRTRGLDGIVATLPYNVFYLTRFNAIAHKADEPRPYAFVLSRHARSLLQTARRPGSRPACAQANQMTLSSRIAAISALP